MQHEHVAWTSGLDMHAWTCKFTFQRHAAGTLTRVCSTMFSRVIQQGHAAWKVNHEQAVCTSNVNDIETKVK